MDGFNLQKLKQKIKKTKKPPEISQKDCILGRGGKVTELLKA